MNPGNVDLAIAYRIYPRVSRETAAFPHDKLKLSELCLASFRRALGSLTVKVWVLLDDCPPEYEALFRAYFRPEELVLVPLEPSGNAATFEKQIEILLEQRDSELVYFAEDDYFYRDGALERMVSFIRSQPDADFVSPYDHLDYYELDLHRYPARIRAAEGQHWRTAGSTCLTFLTRKRVLRATERIFHSYARGNSDAGLWFSLTRVSPWRLLAMARGFFSRDLLFRVLGRAWYHGPVQTGLGPTRKLWVPIPGLATHMDALFLAPAVDWETAMRPEIERIEAAGARRDASLAPAAGPSARA